ncbi:MAG: class I SAM-dependent RNA methyltransferase, partial [Neisseriaceae bacterium]|nr:class I SAM-dependent RNA methyltransferase [Neisseriaceae bacterium]
LGSWLKQYYAGWSAAMFTGDKEMPKLMRLKPKRKIPLYNGKLDCRLFLFDMVSGSNR